MKDFEENLVFEIQMSKVWKSFNSKAQFLAEKELFEERGI